MSRNGDTKGGFNVDEFVANTSAGYNAWSEKLMAPILDAGGALFMPFIKAPEPYQPEKEEEDERGTHDHASDPTKKKPAMLRKEFETRCKQFREAAFLGTLHLPMEYAGISHHCNKELYRATNELNTKREQFKKKYPAECYVLDDKGRVTILPTWDAQGKKQVKLQKDMKPPADMEKGSPDEKHFSAKKARAAKIRFDSKDEKKRKAMEEDAKTFLRRIKDLSSASTKERSTTITDESGKALPRGLILRLQDKLDNTKAVCGLGLYESGPSGTDLRQHATLAMKKQHESHMTIAEHLIDKEGADINSANEDGFTALMLAARNGHTETVAHLMAFPSLNLKKVSNAGCNAMHYAAMYAHKDIVQLLKRGVIEGQTCDRKQKNEYGRTPRDNAEWEGLMLREKKLEIWDKTYKQGLYKLVPELGPKDAPGLFDEMPYKIFGMPNPASVETPKEWEAGRWRLSKVPDPACKIDPIPEAQFLERWNSAAKKCGPKVKDHGAKSD